MRVLIESLAQSTGGESKKFIKNIIPDLDTVKNKISTIGDHIKQSDKAK